MSEFDEKIDAIEKAYVQIENDRAEVIELALRSRNFNDFYKAQTVAKQVEERHKSGRHAMIIDPNTLNTGYGYREKPVEVTYNTLYKMAQTPIINAIVKTRVNQIGAFSNPQYDRHSVGFVIRKKQPYFFKGSEKLNKTEEQEIESITTFMMRCGKDDNWSNEDFDAFLRLITYDSFVFDQINFEVVFDRKGEPVEFLAVDPKTIRLAVSYDDETYRAKNVLPVKGYYPSYVQLYNNTPVRDYYPWELCFGIRNPSSSLHNRGYGRSELEDLINIVTSLLYSEEYNRKFFSQGASPKGILYLKGNQMSADKLNSFKQEWVSSIAGVQNAWKTPIIEADNAQWIDLQKSNQDMEFSKWIEYLIKISSAIYNIDPAEVNFPYSGGDSKPLFEGNNEARLKFSRDKGLRPALKLIESKINRYIVKYFYGGKYEFKFVGLDSSTMQEETDLLIKQITNFKTINEVRNEFNLKPIDNGDIILNATYLSKIQMEQQAEQQALEMMMQNPEGGAVPVSGSGGGSSKDSSSDAGGSTDGGFGDSNPGDDESNDNSEGKNPLSKAIEDLLGKFNL